MDMPERSTNVYVRCNIAKKHGTQNTSKGTPYSRINVTPCVLSYKMSSKSFSFFDNPDQIYEFDDNSTIVLCLSASPPNFKQKAAGYDGIQFNTNFMFPIEAVLEIDAPEFADYNPGE